jgi:predicted nucleic acid-binding protein
LSSVIALDASPLSLLCHPDTRLSVVAEINLWLEARLLAGATVYVPEIADYEVRRELIRAGKRRSLRKLDVLIDQTAYLPLDTAAMRRAAELWAQARNLGTPTALPEALDADVILAAQAERAGAIVATENVSHLARFVGARHWRDITWAGSPVG